jgi:hypothetical protein
MFLEHKRMKSNSNFANPHRLIILSSGLIILLLFAFLQLNLTFAAIKKGEQGNVSLYYFSTRTPPNPQNIGEQHNWFGNDTYLDINQLTKTPCQNEANRTVAIFVHGWEKSEEIVKERLNRVKQSLEKDNFSRQLVGFSWPSDTDWPSAKSIAKANGPKLANLIFELKSSCPKGDIRIIAHSLGARVVLSSLDSLLMNKTWNDRNFKISSVHLVGAAVDNEEVSTKREDILIDATNQGTPKSNYGQAIGAEVIKFYNLFSSKDNLLEPIPGDSYPIIYPLAESDFALGQSGYQKIPYSIKLNLPKNYNDTNVTNELAANCDADGDNHPDVPFSKDNIITTGDNHRGYLGYRDNGTKLITNDGAIDVIVKSWNIEPTNENVNLNPVCPDSSTQ